MKGFLASCLVLLASAAAFAQAAGPFDAFLRDVSSENLPTAAIQAGADRLRVVKFKTESEMGPAAAMYLPWWNEIDLNRSTRDPATGAVKLSAQLGPVDSAVVIHELWHSYYRNQFRAGGGEAAELFRRGWRERYDAYPAGEREGIQEEAYALYIQEASRAYLQIHQILRSAAPDRRRVLMADPRFAAAYERGLRDNVYGYYRGRGGFPVTVAVPLTAEDKASIRAFFFAGRLTGTLARDFAEFSR